MVAHGATQDRKLGIKDEHKIISSRRIVNWYNGSLDNDLETGEEFPIQNLKDLTIIGNGNIFCDISRILLKNPNDLVSSDIPENILN